LVVNFHASLEAQSEDARGRQVIIIKGSSVIGSLVSLSSSFVFDFFFRWSITLFMWWRGRSQLATLRIFKLLLENIDLSLELELLELGGELLYTRALWSAVLGAVLPTEP
jgi:hypothetical protein